MKTLILILSCNKPEFENLRINGTNKTWNSSEIEGVTRTVNFYGGAEETHEDEKGIHLTSPDGYDAELSRKTLDAFEYALNHFEFDYLLRPNQSSYIDKKRYVKFLENKPREGFYSGVVGIYPNDGHRFASGSAFTLSRDLVEYLVEHKDELLYLVDDVAIAKMLNHVDIYPAPRISYLGRSIEAIENNHESPHFHFRCCGKSSPNREQDIDTFHWIHESIKEGTM